MNTTTLFYVIGCFVDTIQSPYTWQRKKREKERKFNSKNTASSSKRYYFLEYLVFFFKNHPTKKKIGGKNWRSYYRCAWYTYDIKDALDNHEQSGGGAGCKRPRQRGTDAPFTCVLLRSCRDEQRPRHLPNAKTAAIFQPDPDGTTKKQISYFGDPQTGEVSY